MDFRIPKQINHDESSITPIHKFQTASGDFKAGHRPLPMRSYPGGWLISADSTHIYTHMKPALCGKGGNRHATMTSWHYPGPADGFSCQETRSFLPACFWYNTSLTIMALGLQAVMVDQRSHACVHCTFFLFSFVGCPRAVESGGVFCLGCWDSNYPPSP